MKCALALACCLVVAGCDAAPPARPKAEEGALLLRAVYRSAAGAMVLIVPEKGRQLPRGSCGTPLFIDARTGQVRILGEAEVQARLRTMQLAGATRGACPRD